MAGDMAKVGAVAQLTLNIRIHGTHDRHRIGICIFNTKDLTIDRRQDTGVLIRLTPDHHAIHMRQMRFRVFQRLDPAVN